MAVAMEYDTQLRLLLLGDGGEQRPPLLRARPLTPRGSLVTAHASAIAD